MVRRRLGLGLALLMSCTVCFGPTAASASHAGTHHSMRRSAHRRSVGRVFSDATITGKVKSALIGDKRVAAANINVDTVQGIVHLRGRARSRGEARRAVMDARRVAGVRGVRSHLRVAAR